VMVRRFSSFWRSLEAMAGGQVIVADDAPELIEGSWHGKRTVGFDSVEAARNWYRSPQYQGVVGLRRCRGQQRSDRRELRDAGRLT
jgi:uncharacterized protein (DUF1330 family)